VSTSTYSAAPINTNGSTFYAWAHPIAAFLAACGWLQSPDTGQVVWPVSIVNLVSVVANGATAVFTYTLLQGAALRIGNSIILKGCTTAGLNVTAVITALGAGTFTVATGTTVTETETASAAFGSVNPQIAITNALGNGSSNTYTYTLLDGPDPINGQSIAITGCTTAGFNATLTIATVNTGAKTFTTTTGITHASEAETGTGIVQCIPAVISTSESTNTTMPPAASTFLYEVWKMGDGNSQPIYLRINYGTNAGAATPGLSFVLQAATDGAGGIPAATGNSGTITGFLGNTSEATSRTSYMSGASNRLQLAIFPNSSVSNGCILNVERSHDSSGNDTTSNQYATITALGFTTGSAVTVSQVSITAANQTVTETRLPCTTNHSAGTGSFGLSTLMSPVDPVVGARGNPMIGLLVGKNVDWTDLTQFPYTIYSVSRNFLILNNTGKWSASNSIVYDSVPVPCVAMRFE
jgi:hypothetical protein